MTKPNTALKAPFSDPHQAERIELAATFRWCARLNMHESIANHFSFAVSDDGSKFLMNPNRQHFSRVRASDLLLLDANDPDTLNHPDAPDRTAWGVHGSIHRAVPQARCIMHTHSKYATVLASLKDSSMPPIDQSTMRFYDRIAVDDGYDGVAMDEEAERLATRLGDKSILVMGNHGLLVVADTIAQAFDDLYYFERACETVITAYTTGKELRYASEAVARKTARQWADYPDFANFHLREIKAILDREEPEYRM